MSTTLSMWLGMVFVALALIAVLLQAWLWNPKYWDAEKKKSHAPPFWMWVHRIVGYAFLAVYVLMMLEMVPRLWEYQIELPARTVVHAAMAITIGVLLVVKILILRFFRWFEESMPLLGLGILLCTIVLATFSIPFALRAHGSEEAFEAHNRRRVRTILSRLELGEGLSASRLSSESALRQGREVVVQRCAQCHDMRTILAEPRTGQGWLSTCRRMQDKPTIDVPLSDDEVLFATAYLIAITPAIQEDVQRQREERIERDEIIAAVDEPPLPEPEQPAVLDAGVVEIPDAGVAEIVDAGVRRRRRRDGGVSRAPAVDAGQASEPAPREPPPAEPPRPFFYNAGIARRLVAERCSTECHGMEDIDQHGGDDHAGWSAIVARMVRRGAELDANEARIVAQYLANTYPQ